MFHSLGKWVQMKRKKQNRKYIAWLLLITFMSFFGIKASHYHEETHSATHDECQSCPKSPCNQCPICDFAFSPFLQQAKASHNNLITPTLIYEQEISQDKVYKTELYPYYLHAPPIRF